MFLVEGVSEILMLYVVAVLAELRSQVLIDFCRAKKVIMISRRFVTAAAPIPHC